jgi:integrase
MEALLAEARIKGVRLHDARHTAGTLPGELHVDMHVIQQILGHAQITTTRRYTDPTNPMQREAADKIGGLLWPEIVGDGQGDTTLKTSPTNPERASVPRPKL